MKNQLLVLCAIGVFVICTAEITSDNGKAGYTGSPGESKCNNCHNTYTLNTGGGSVTLGGISNWQYIPGQTYNMTLTVARAGNSLFGLGLEALTSSNTNAGTLVITNSSTQIKTKTINGVSRNNVVHTFNGGASADLKVFSFNWVAPATNVGPVTMYYNGVAANGNGNENNDYVYSGSQVISPVTTGIETFNTENSFSVSPIPANDFLDVKFSLTKSEKVSITLYDINGRNVTNLLPESIKSGECLEHFNLKDKISTKGIYFLRMNVSGKLYDKKILLN